MQLTVVFIGIRYLGRIYFRFHIIIVDRLIADDLTDTEAKAQIRELQGLCHSITKSS